MNEQMEAKVWLPGDDGIHRLTDVNVMFEADGYRAIGVWIEDEHGNDVTDDVSGEEYERICDMASAHLLESMTEAAEMYMEGER